MSNEVKDLGYYEDHPEEIPGDPDAIDALIAKVEHGGDDPKTEQPVESAPDGAEDGKEDRQKAPEAPEGEAKPDEDEDKGEDEGAEPAILSKNGKELLPYSALTAARQQERAARAAYQELLEKYNRLVPPVSTSSPPAPQENVSLSSEDLEELKDFPAGEKLIHAHKTLLEKFDEVSRKAEYAASVAQAETNKRAQIEREALQAAVDDIPELSLWQSEATAGKDGTRWNAAVQAYDLVEQNPEFVGLPVSEKLQKVRSMVNAYYGTTENPKQEKPAPNRQTTNDAVKPTRQPAFTGISDIAGGTATETDPREEFSKLSPAELAARMSAMNSEQIDALLSRIA
jgi:hypothetical protein